MKKILEFYNIGIDADMSFEMQRNVRILNVIGIFAIIVSIPFFFPFFAPKTGELLYMQKVISSTSIVGGILCFYLNYKRKNQIGQYFITIYYAIYFLITPYVVKFSDYIHLYYLILALYVILFIKNSISKGIILVFIASLYFLSLYLYANPENEVYKPNYVLIVTNHTFVLLFLVVVATLFKRESDLYQELILQKGKVLEEQKRKIDDSIQYARRLQVAMISDFGSSPLTPSHFIVYLPKDIISGDFYWSTQKGDIFYFVVGDCTGHGVPGAMLTVLAMNTLDQIFAEEKSRTPDQILEEVDKRIISALKQSDSSIQDGLELFLGAWKPSTNEFLWSSAGIDLYLYNNPTIEIIKSDKISLGGESKKSPKKFSLKTLNVEKGMQMYISSDGLRDQFGGSECKKYGRKRYLSLLQEVSKLTVSSRASTIEKEILSWKQQGKEVQTDDITLVGLNF